MTEKVDINTMSDRQAEKWFWSDINKICLDCVNKCKQSSKITLMQCLKFKKIGE